MKTRFLLTTIMLALTLFAIAQQVELLESVSETQLNLSGQLSEKLNNIRANPLIKSTQPVRVGSIAALQNRGVILISIPGRKGKLVAETTQIEYLSEDHYTWHGTFKKEEGTALIMAREGRIFGQIRLEKETYDIQYLENGLAILVEYDQEALNNITCGTPDDLPEKDESSGRYDTGSDSRTAQQAAVVYPNVRVLVLFTTAANNAVANINDMATLAVQQLNDAKYNSAVTTTQLTFVRAETRFLNFTETGLISNDISNLSNNITAQNLRNQFEADLVVLLTNGNYGNVVGIVDEIGPDEPHAYSIVQVGAATSALTFAHEAVHLMGGRHQQCSIFLNGGCDNTTGDPHGYNFTYQTGVWPFRTEHYKRTIMHQYRDEYDRISYFSNPDVNFGPKDKATGVAGEQNVARILRVNAPVVEDFRDYHPALSVNISGPYGASTNEYLAFSASVYGGTSPFQHQWWVSTDGYYYAYKGSGSVFHYTMPDVPKLYIRLSSTDAAGGSDIDFHEVTNDGRTCVRDCGPIINPDARITLEGELEDQIPELVYSFYPNPTSALINLSISTGEEKTIGLTLTDMQGKIVKDFGVPMFSGDKPEFQMDLSGLPGGIYLLRMSQGDRAKMIRLVKK